MISNSKDDHKKFSDSDDKNLRSGYSHSYPLTLHNRPSSDYTGYVPGYTGVTYSHPQTSLISANVHLLEPFMLVTFLLFVLSLIDKARYPPLISRKDVLKDATTKITAEVLPTNDHYYHHSLSNHWKSFGDRNETEF